MKKYISLVFVVIFGLLSFHLYRENLTLVEEKNGLVSRQASLKSEIRLLNDDVDYYKEDISNFEMMIERMIKSDFESGNITPLFIKSRVLQAEVIDGDRVYPLPSNGLIETTSDHVSIKISHKKLPTFHNEVLNEFFHSYDNFTDYITYDYTDSRNELVVEDESITYTTSDLAMGINREIFLKHGFSSILGMSDRVVTFRRVDTLEDPLDYLPENVSEKVFYNDINNTTFSNVHQKDPSGVERKRVSGYDLYYNAIYQDRSMQYELIKDNRVLAVSRNNTHFKESDRVLLPDKIQLGETWQAGSLVGKITGLNIPIETEIRSYETLEVTYYTSDDETLCKVFFAKSLGDVLRIYANGSEELKKIYYKYD